MLVRRFGPCTTCHVRVRNHAASFSWNLNMFFFLFFYLGVLFLGGAG